MREKKIDHHRQGRTKTLQWGRKSYDTYLGILTHTDLYLHSVLCIQHINTNCNLKNDFKKSLKNTVLVQEDTSSLTVSLYHFRMTKVLFIYLFD